MRTFDDMLEKQMKDEEFKKNMRLFNLSLMLYVQL